MIIAFDFDGTVCTHKFPDIGIELPGAIFTLKVLQENGHQLFLWTMRGHPDLSKFPHIHKDTGKFIEHDTLQEAIDWLEARGLKNFGINTSPAQFSTSPKQYAAVYIDDAALGCPKKIFEPGIEGVDWRIIARNLYRAQLITLNQYVKIFNEITVNEQKLHENNSIKL